MSKNKGAGTAVGDIGILFNVGAVGGLSDGQLLGRFVERQEDAVFEAIVRRHGPMVWAVCRRVLRDYHDAEDPSRPRSWSWARCASAVMPQERLGNWLYGVAHKTATKARGMRAKRRMREGQVSDMPEPIVKPDDPRDAVAESIDRELSRLPEKYRIAVVLCDLEGRNHKEVANQLGCPVGTVSSRLACRLLREGVTLDELDRARKGYLEKLRLGRTSDASLASTLANNLHLGRALAFDADLERKVRALTPETVNAAVRKYFDPKALTSVVAGDFKEAEPEKEGDAPK